jgi:hypothetical protein
MIRLILTVTAIVTMTTAALLCATGPAAASMIAADDFESYTAGQTIIGQGTAGSGWDGAYSGLNPSSSGGTSLRNVSADVMSGFGKSLELGPLTVGSTNSTNNNIVQRSFTAQTDTIYVGFVMKTSGFDTGGSGSFAGDFIQVYLNNTSNTSGTSGSQGTSLSDGADINTEGSGYFVRKGGDQTLTSTAPANDEIHRLVMKISKSGATANYDQISLFVDQMTEGTPDASRGASETAAVAVTTLSKLHMRIYGMELNDRVYLDDLRIGTTYGDVVPEPSIAAMAFACLAFAVAACRKTQRVR